LKKLKKILFGRLFITALLILLQFLLHFLFLYYLSTYSSAIYSLMIGVSLLLVIAVVNDDTDPSFKLAWVIAMLVLPFFSWALYLLFGHSKIKTSRQKNYIQSEENHRSTETTTDDIIDENPDFLRQYEFLKNSADARVFRNTETKFFPCGEEFFPEYLQALESAEKFIFMEYFIISQGEVWDKVSDILEKKAADGVDVRIMFDDMGTIALLPHNFVKTLAKVGIKAVAFNRMRPSIDPFLNHRDHRKITVIDGKTAFTGGLNIADEYMNINSPYGYWKDYALRLDGDAVESLTRMFLQLWEFATGEPVVDVTQYFTEHRCACDGYVIPYCDSPINHRYPGKHAALNMISSAKKYIWITTPYLILDDATATALRLAAKSGVDVRIITPHIPDKKAVFQVTRANYPSLVKSGVKIYEFTEGFIHAKSILCDDMYAIIGTMNFDFRSFYFHFENSVFLYKSNAIKELKSDNEKIFLTATEITDDDIRKTNIFVKIYRSVLKLFAPFL